MNDAELLISIRAVKAEHAFWGYRRVWAYLRFVQQRLVNKKRVYRIMKENAVLVTKETRLKARRTSGRPKPRPDRANQWWGIDMTKVLTAEGWA